MHTHELYVVAYAFILALGLILPLGAQNSFVLSIGAHSKRFYQTLPVVIAASLCDTLLILLAVMGVSIAAMELEWLKMILIIAGSIFLLYFGWSSFKTKSDTTSQHPFIPSGIIKQILLITTFSILNPFALIDIIMVIGSNAMTFNEKDRYIFTITCILVSWLWFLFLAKIGQKLGSKFRDNPWKGKTIALTLWASAFLLLYRGLMG